MITKQVYHSRGGCIDKVEYYAFNRYILAVAAYSREYNTWSAYIDVVAGNDHTAEAEITAEYGSLMTHEIASIIFPKIAAEYKWEKIEP